MKNVKKNKFIFLALNITMNYLNILLAFILMFVFIIIVYILLKIYPDDYAKNICEPESV